MIATDSHEPSAPEPADSTPEAPPTEPGSDAEGREGVGEILKRLGPSAWLAGFWTFAPAICGLTLLVSVKPVGEWLESLGGAALPVYIGLFILLAGIGVLPTLSQAIVAGFVFGWAVGIPAALAGFSGAAIIGYFIARCVDHHRVEAEIDRHPRARLLRDALIGRPGWRRLFVVTLLRVPPNSPFALTNLALSAVRVPLPVFLVATVVGLLPRTAAAVVFGTQLSNLDDVKMPLAYRIIGLVVTVAVLLVIGKIAQRTLDRLQGATPTPERVEEALRAAAHEKVDKG